MGYFLANVLPRWRERWNVTLGERLQALLLRCEYLAPEVATRPAGNDWLAVDLKFKDSQGATPLTPVEVRQLLQKASPTTGSRAGASRWFPQRRCKNSTK